MKLKKKRTEGVCIWDRCKAPNTGDSPFCARHFNEWTAEGRPDVDAPPPPKETGTDIEVVKAEIVQARDFVGQYLQAAATVPLDTQEALNWLGGVREMARQAIAELEAKRTAITKPMLEAKRGVDALFAPAKEQAEALLATCTSRLNEHARALKAAQDAALAQVSAGARDDATLAIAHGGMPQLPPEVRTQRKFGYEVTDFEAVPACFKQIDEQALVSYITAKSGQCEIPGVRVVVTDEVRTA